MTIDFDYTLALMKPDALAQNLIPEILDLARSFGVSPTAFKFVRFTRKMVDEFYAEHVGKGFYPAHAKFMTSGPSLAMILVRRDMEREDQNPMTAVELWRDAMGNTDPIKATAEWGGGELGPTTVRSQAATRLPMNLVHGSESQEAADREIELLDMTDHLNFLPFQGGQTIVDLLATDADVNAREYAW